MINKGEKEPYQSATKFVFSCSGAADVGEIADQASRELNRKGISRMSCSAALGGKVPQILEIARGASAILAIDGCPLDCVKKSLAVAGILRCLHLRVTDLGMTKGKTVVSEQNISIVVSTAESMLALIRQAEIRD